SHVPILNYCLFAKHDGNSEVAINAITVFEIHKTWSLTELASFLKSATERWSAKYLDESGAIPEFEALQPSVLESDVSDDFDPYAVIKKEIRDKKKKSH
ncbi:unnamed protein product, partial [marine sediment metagenome]